jgi:hypothetical protein
MAVLASMVLTPIIVYLWSRAFPVRNDQEFAAIDYQILKRRNGWIDNIATAMMFAGLATPFLLMRFIPEENAMWLSAWPWAQWLTFIFFGCVRQQGPLAGNARESSGASMSCGGVSEWPESNSSTYQLGCLA